MGRPKVTIDWNEVDRYLKAQCDGASIARLIGIHPETLYRRCQKKFSVGFVAYSEQKKGEGKELLREMQYATAMSGNVPMQIWLGKQYLDQADKKEITQPDNKYKEAVQQLIDAKAAKDALEAIQLLKDVNFPPPPGVESEIVKDIGTVG